MSSRSPIFTEEVDFSWIPALTPETLSRNIDEDLDSGLSPNNEDLELRSSSGEDDVKEQGMAAWKRFSTPDNDHYLSSVAVKDWDEKLATWKRFSTPDNNDNQVREQEVAAWKRFSTPDDNDSTSSAGPDDLPGLAIKHLKRFSTPPGTDDIHQEMDAWKRFSTPENNSTANMDWDQGDAQIAAWKRFSTPDEVDAATANRKIEHQVAAWKRFSTPEDDFSSPGKRLPLMSCLSHNLN